MIIGLVGSTSVVLLAGVVVTTSLFLQVDEERSKAEAASIKAAAGQQFLSNVLSSSFPPGYGDQVTVLDILDRASQKLTGAFPDDPETDADLRRSLANAYRNIGHYRSSERELITARRLRESTWGTTHDKTLDILEDLDQIYTLLGDTKGLHETAQAIATAIEERYGDSREMKLMANSYLIYSFTSQGSLAEARQLSEESWMAYKQIYGDDTSSTLREQVRLGWLSLETGQTERAQELTQDAVERSNRVYGPNSDMARNARSLLAGVYIVQNKIDSAALLYGNRQIPDKFGVERVFQGEFDYESDPFQLLVFFESWCPYSLQAMHELEVVHHQYDQLGFNVVGLTRVNKNATEQKVEQYLVDEKISFATVKENGRSWNYFDCGGTPSIRLLCNGYQVWEGIGPTPSSVPICLLEALVQAQSSGALSDFGTSSLGDGSR